MLTGCGQDIAGMTRAIRKSTGEAAGNESVGQNIAKQADVIFRGRFRAELDGFEKYSPEV